MWPQSEKHAPHVVWLLQMQFRTTSHNLPASFLNDVTLHCLSRSVLIWIHFQSSVIVQWTAVTSELFEAKGRTGDFTFVLCHFFFLTSAFVSIQLILEIWFSTTGSDDFPHHLQTILSKKNHWGWVVHGNVILNFLVVIVRLSVSMSFLPPPLPFLLSLKLPPVTCALCLVTVLFLRDLAMSLLSLSPLWLSSTSSVCMFWILFYLKNKTKHSLYFMSQS